MFRFRYLFPLLLAVLTAIITSSVLAAPKKSSVSLNDGREIPQYVLSYASDQNIDVNTAIQRLALQDLAGDLDAELSRNEEDIYAGLWV